MFTISKKLTIATKITDVTLVAMTLNDCKEETHFNSDKLLLNEIKSLQLNAFDEKCESEDNF